MRIRKHHKWAVAATVVAVAIAVPLTIHQVNSTVVTQSSISSTICKGGWTKTVRPPVSFTDNLKVQQIKRYGYTDTNPSSYQEDHAISLEVGGQPKDPSNLWPEPIAQAHLDDQTENQINKKVCSGQETLAQGQAEELQLKIAHGYKPELSK